MITARCRYCGKVINKWNKRNSLFCGTLCRQRHWDIENRPKHNKKALKRFISVVEN